MLYQRKNASERYNGTIGSLVREGYIGESKDDRWCLLWYFERQKFYFTGD